MVARKMILAAPRVKPAPEGPDAMGRVRREISIQRLLEWAFADECAQVDFEDAGTLAQGYGHIGNAQRMADRGALGCRIDGGGRSYPDADADLVASAVSVLPVICGGRPMAVQIAELARARRVPDVMAGAKEWNLYPVATKRNPHGVFAVKESLGFGMDYSGRKPRRYNIEHCPVKLQSNIQAIGRVRQNYLLWRRALVSLRQTFDMYNDMSRWSVSDVLPSRRPWENTV